MKNKQQGAALIIMMLVLLMVAMSVMFSYMDGSSVQIERDKKTAAALAEAKAALIGYAVKSGGSTGAARPGDLPCPDLNNDGLGELSSCGKADGSNLQANRIGRLPWKTLGIEDLRDGSGERLWYAVSNNYKNNTRTSVLNSETIGTISLKNREGNVVNDATSGTGLVALIIAPNAPIGNQKRDLIGLNTPGNYLEQALNESNTDFIDSQANGFIMGSIQDGAGNTILNDSLLGITSDEMNLAMGKRVAGEVLNCLKDYARNNGNKYPWPALISATDFLDTKDITFGRVSDTPFKRTKDINFVMSDAWGGACKIQSNSSWWPQWKNLVFFAIAEHQRPASNILIEKGCAAYSPTEAPAGCIKVNDKPKSVVVIVSNKAILSQQRGEQNKTALSHYLEGINLTGNGKVFERKQVGPSYNDIVVYD